jgi:hypothetical protein
MTIVIGLFAMKVVLPSLARPMLDATNCRTMVLRHFVASAKVPPGFVIDGEER